MTVEELEKKVWDQDRIRIIVRDGSRAKIKEYCQTRSTCKNWSIAKFLKKRIEPLIKDKEIVVFDGDGKMPNRKTLLKTIRQSYN